MPIVILDALIENQAPCFSASLTDVLSTCQPAFSVAIGCGRGTRDLVGQLEPPLMVICIDGHEALCGPLFIPGRTACPACLLHWIDLRLYDRVDDVTGIDARGSEVLAAKLHEWFERFRRTGFLEELAEYGLSVDLREGREARHFVFRRADCASCGKAPPAHPSSLYVHCSPWTGIVQQVELTGTPVAGAYRSTAVWTPPRPVGSARSDLRRRQSFGRGRTPLEAGYGCIGEALERYSLVYRGDERMTRARLCDIDAIDPSRVLLFSDEQYANRHEWNATAEELFHVPEPFDSEIEVDWLAVQPLGRAASPAFAAAASCLMWYEFKPGEPAFARADTVGCATGPTRDAALYGALLEWVERDAMAIWWDNMVPRPALIPESFGCPDIDLVERGLRAIDRQLFLLDCTTDIGIPSYVAVAPRVDGSEPLVAGAADVSPHVAAYRAASEVGQIWYEARRSEALSTLVSSWLLHTNVADHPYLRPASVREAPRMRGPESGRTWSTVVEHLESVHLQAYVVDHSRSDVCVPTVRAIVPGLRHIWNRRGPGRLYNVPVKMGWRKEPALERDLNPVRCMI